MNNQRVISSTGGPSKMSIVAANSAGMEIKMVMKSAVQNHISRV